MPRLPVHCLFPRSFPFAVHQLLRLIPPPPAHQPPLPLNVTSTDHSLPYIPSLLSSLPLVNAFFFRLILIYIPSYFYIFLYSIPLVILLSFLHHIIPSFHPHPVISCSPCKLFWAVRLHLVFPSFHLPVSLYLSCAWFSFLLYTNLHVSFLTTCFFLSPFLIVHSLHLSPLKYLKPCVSFYSFSLTSLPYSFLAYCSLIFLALLLFLLLIVFTQLQSLIPFLHLSIISLLASYD